MTAPARHKQLIIEIHMGKMYFTLHGALSFVGLSPMKYKGHSFRIGAATWAMQLGKSDAQIRSSGCWHSNAFLKYIRPDYF
jgi:hypothetical protein